MTKPESVEPEGSKRIGLVSVLFALSGLGILAALGLGCFALALDRRPSPDILQLMAGALGLFVIPFLVWVVGPSAAKEASARPEAWLCHHCLKPYVPGAHFFPRCVAPQTFYAATAEYERVYATSWCLGKAAWYPSRWLHAVGLLLITVPAGLAGLTILFFTFAQGEPGTPWYGIVLAGLYAGALAFVYGGLLLIGVGSWIRVARDEPRAQPEIEYGAPPWWTCDVDWWLPEYEVDPDEVAPAEDGI